MGAGSIVIIKPFVVLEMKIYVEIVKPEFTQIDIENKLFESRRHSEFLTKKC